MYHCECGWRLSLHELVIVPTDSATARMKDSPSKFRWFHATQVPDWYHAVVSAGVSVHVGEYEASRDIALAEWYKNDEADPFWLYEVEVDPSAPVASRVYRDMNSDDVFRQGMVCRYVNRWESPGCLSLYLPARFLKVVSICELVKTDDMKDSLYLVDMDRAA